MKKNQNMNRGAAILSIIFALLFFVLFVRFFYIQITGKVDGQLLAVKAQEKYENKITLEAQRGNILDRNGEVLAQDTSTFTLVAVLDESLTTDPDHPQHVVDPQETAEKLAPLINMDVSEVLSILTKDRKQVEFGTNGRNISFSKKKEIEALGLPGIGFIRDTKRFYPNGNFASNVIGFAQNDQGKTVGKLGIEKYLNKYLQEKDGYVKYEQDHYGFKLPNSDDQIVSPDNGANVYLTIDQKIQTFLEDAMNEVEKEYQPQKMIGIVIDPKTGKILAMTQRPSFDPNKRNIVNYYNDAISYAYEPGSTMKIFTLAAAINEGVYKGDEKYRSGTYPVKGSKPIRDHNNKGWGTITFDEGVQRSSNVAFAIIAKEKLGFDTFYHYLEQFGFTKKTGIDLPNEGTSKINFQYEVEKITTAFGQGTAVTPIQQIQAATAIANDGKMMKPYIIEKVVDPDDGEVLLENKPIVVREPITKETANKVRDILGTVVSSENGTGQPYQIEGYEVAGKTGTAQIAGKNGKYLTGRENYIFSFLGMAPKDNPRLLVYVAVQQPKLKPTEVGSAPVSKIFKTVMKNGLEYLQVKPDHNTTRQKSEMNIGFLIEDFSNQDVQKVSEQLMEQKMDVITLGDGKTVIAQYPLAHSRVIANEKILLKTDGQVTMPDITGWSLRDVWKLASILDLDLDYEGNGYVQTQSIKAGTKIKNKASLTVKLTKKTDLIQDQKEQ
ncbi:penicillin-binding protein [Aeribacillus alveayuensis]|uniref:serine-type D-Ala-D-Ala carboxypeptidase n=1 Tax=Aeribacillus alveayuensis TaxID=279215 RepID=A0ABT9VKY7_9BACI|nr:penicillin-binding protein 2B [Bacillus alveayuensis]